MKPKAIEVQIDELVLNGFAVDGRGVAQAVERELTRLLAERGLPAAFAPGEAHAVLEGRGVELGARQSANSVGSSIAGAIHGAKKP
jgi:hypothetical protein